jgi:mRNA-degrading endonuclease HigB of HigAB toxin-antitoxin module
MTERTFVDKNGNSWFWEETPETIEALKQLHKTVEQTTLKKPNEYKTTNN